MKPNRSQGDWFWVIFELSRVTFLDIVRDKILYNSLFFGMIVFLLGALSSQFTVSHPGRMVIDFGLTGVSLSLNALALLLGAGLLSKEIERRTLYVTLSRPITRMQFLLGKYFGLAKILLLNWIFLSVAYSVLILVFQVDDHPPAQVVFVGLGFALLEALMVGVLALLFSTFTTTSLSVMFVLGIYLIGKNMTELILLIKRMDHGFPRLLLAAMTYIIPNFEQFGIGSQVTYGIAIPNAYVFAGLGYTLAVILVALSASGLIFNQREL